MLLQSVNDEDRVISYSYDFLRTLRFFCFGVGMSPMLGKWNKFLEVRFPLRPAGNKGPASLKALAKRVSADQFIMAPLGLSIFLASMGIMEGRDRVHVVAKFRDLYKPAIIANWEVWPLAQFVNFRFMPLPYRVPFQQTCGVFWTLYLSTINSKESMLQDRDDGRTTMIHKR